MNRAPEFTLPSPAAIKAACQLLGGVSPVTRRAGIDRANFLRWLEGAPTLSAARVSSLLDALGLPDGKPDTCGVHHWRVRHGFLDWKSALRLYFPRGAYVRKAPWSELGRRMLLNVATFRYTPEVFALTDGSVRAIVRASTGVLLPVAELSPYIRWSGENEAESILDITPTDQIWLSGEVGIDLFDSRFESLATPEGAVPALGMAEVERLMLQHGLTPLDIIQLITDSVKTTQGRRS